MEETLQAARKVERRRKQEYLVRHVLDAGLADPFSEFLRAERANGEEVDVWSLEELESMVALFKRASAETLGEELEPAEDDRCVFAKRLSVARRPPPSPSVRPIIARAEQTDYGFFGGKTLLYTLAGEPEVGRTEADFRWLNEALTRECPWTAVPPLFPRKKATFSAHAIERSRADKQIFLEEVQRHPILGASLSLAAFLHGSRDQLAARGKELSREWDRIAPLAPNLTKRAFEALGGDVMARCLAPNGVLELKLSPITRSYLLAAEGQYTRYECLLDKAERCVDECAALMKRLRDEYGRLHATLCELQSVSARHNAARPFYLTATFLEEKVYARIAAFVEQQAVLLDDGRRALKEHLSTHFRHVRRHAEEMERALSRRGFFAGEFQKARAALQERQQRVAEPGADEETVRALGLSLAAGQSPNSQRGAAQIEETAKLRRYGEVFGVVNLAVFRELRRFEERLVEATVERFEAFCRAGIGLLQRQHSVWAEATLGFGDFGRLLREAPAPDRPLSAIA